MSPAGEGGGLADAVAGPLTAHLRRAQGLGFVGPGDVLPHLEHATGFLPALAGCRGPVLDLGTGAGLPGLVIALVRTDLEVVLLDAMAKRCRFLEQAVVELGVATRVQVECARAEVAGRGPRRGELAAVTARSFGAPATTAECAAPFLAVGGVLLVSEPADGGDRWPAEPLATLGLRPVERRRSPIALQVLEQVERCPDRYPRRDGRPAARPLF